MHFPKRPYCAIYCFVVVSLLIGFIVTTVLFVKANHIVRHSSPYLCTVLQKEHHNVPCRQGPDPGICDQLTYKVSFQWKANVTLTANIDIKQGHTVSTKDPHYSVGDTYTCYVEVKYGYAIAAYWSLPPHWQAYRVASVVSGTLVFTIILISVAVMVFLNANDTLGVETRRLLSYQ